MVSFSGLEKSILIVSGLYVVPGLPLFSKPLAYNRCIRSDASLVGPFGFNSHSTWTRAFDELPTEEFFGLRTYLDGGGIASPAFLRLGLKSKEVIVRLLGGRSE